MRNGPGFCRLAASESLVGLKLGRASQNENEMNGVEGHLCTHLDYTGP